MDTCMYCEKDQRLRDLMLEVVRLKTTTVYLHRECTFPGRVVLALNRHVHKLTDLSEAENRALFEESSLVAKVITELYHPDKLNYLILGDLCPHLHIHIVPKYKGGDYWGEMFPMLPQPAKMRENDEAYREEIEKLREEIKKKL